MPTTVQDVIAIGTLAARPAAGSGNLGYLYFATDVNSGTLYRSNGATWAQVAPGVGQAGFSNPMTTAQDIIVGGTAGAAARLAKGTDNQVLTVIAGVLTWQTPAAGGMANPMTTLGDIITGGGAGAPNRLGVGTAAQVLTVTGGVPAWATPSAGATSPTGFGGSKTASFTSNDSTWSNIGWTEEYDSDGYHAGTSGDIIVPAGKNGTYRITAWCPTPDTTTGSQNLRIRETVGAVTKRACGPNASNVQRMLIVEWVGVLSVGDTINIDVMQSQFNGSTWPCTAMPAGVWLQKIA